MAIAKCRYRDLGMEAEFPINDQTQPCKDDVAGDKVRRDSRQQALPAIKEPDRISGSGEEIYSFFVAHRIRNVVHPFFRAS